MGNQERTVKDVAEKLGQGLSVSDLIVEVVNRQSAVGRIDWKSEYNPGQLEDPCKELTRKELESKEIKAICKRVLTAFETGEMKALGLAANQIGIQKRFFFLKIKKKDVCKASESTSTCKCIAEDGKYVYVCLANPSVTKKGKLMRLNRETCLSIDQANVFVWKKRSVQTTLKGTCLKCIEEIDIGLKGTTSICAEHEMDHLGGILLTSRMTKGKKTIRKWLQRLTLQYK